MAFAGIMIMIAAGALLSIPGYPFWSLCVFLIDVLVIYGDDGYGGKRHGQRAGARGAM